MPDFNSKVMFSKLNIYLVLKANFNSNLMFSEINIFSLLVLSKINI